MELISKLPNAETSIFPVMTALANKHNAINLAQGFPGFGADPKLLDLICDYTKKGFNQYAPLTGVMRLKESLSEKSHKAGGRYYHPESEICVTAGATQAIYTAISAVVNEGDEVIIIDPSYDCYEPAVVLNKGIPLRSALKKGSYEVDWEDVKNKVSPRTKVIMINSPHNPTGSVWSQSDIDELVNIVKDTNILILSDEVYEHLVFDGRKHLSICNVPELAERAFVVYSFGKTYHLTGWRVGYVLAPEFLMQEFVKCHQFQTYAVNTPIQHAIADYSQDESTHLALNDFFQTKRDFFMDCVKGSRFDALVPSGTYFALLDYSRITNEDDRFFADRLTIDYGVASIPISVFFKDKRQDQVLRFCFAKDNDELERAAEKLIVV
ncbi:MAG: methionine aminotransferase [Saprospiraceae bacterium]|jgi:methionine aminotransferase